MIERVKYLSLLEQWRDLDNEPYFDYKALYSHVKANLCVLDWLRE